MDQYLDQMADPANLLKFMYMHMALSDLAFTVAELGIHIWRLDQNKQWIMNAIQQDQDHRLAIDLLSSKAIAEIFACLVPKTTSMPCHSLFS